MSDTWNDRLALAIEHRKETSSNITNAAIAEVAGVTKSSVGYWIHKDPARRVANIDSQALLKTCKFLEINPFWVMFGEGVMGVRWGGSEAIDSVNDNPTLGITKYYKYERVLNYTLKNDKTFTPRIYEGDVLFIDEKQKKLANGNVYLFHSMDDNEHYVRRYFNDPVKKLYTLVDGNADEKSEDGYTAEEFSEILKTLQVVGCVVGRYTESL